jgi:hypothetical protein
MKMNNAKTTAISGCVIWILLISFISSCVMPVFFMVGGFTSASDFAIKITGGWLCPGGSTPKSYSYQTTTHDENGFDRPATAYELQCVGEGGAVVKTDPILYAFIWIGIWAVVGLIVSVVLTFIFAVPGGMLVTRVLNKMKSSQKTTNINN